MMKFPLTMFLGIVSVMVPCAWGQIHGYQSGNYYYICNHKTEKCLTSATVNPNRVYNKDLDLHWEEQQRFVWKVSTSSNEYAIENIVGGSYDPDKRVYLSYNVGDDYLDLYELTGDLQRWNIEGGHGYRGDGTDVPLYQIYNEERYKDGIACWFWCDRSHLYANDDGTLGLDKPASWQNEDYDDDKQLWYLVPVAPYDNLGIDPASTTMTQCQGDCDSDDDCASGYDCFERPYGDCETDCEMPKECFIKKGETSYAGAGAWDPCVSTITAPVVLPFDAPRALPFDAPRPSEGGKYYFVFGSEWMVAAVVVLTVVNVVVIAVWWCTRRRTRKVVYKMVEVDSEAEELK